ncbi:hypothetical protein Bca52824_087686 [Brassica carinata]|uniref:CCHC-type domain-containing protein n=1 Tax=Brassica carinata TaxID=52824 RepID=A0A8X7PCC6_BRACI|nr:hypothetical protein Bca52824_087686 [Brassica carinata]
MPLDFNHNSAAKILVEVELSKGFPSRIADNDENGFISMVDVDYAWLPSKCERCGQLGYKIKHCLESVTKSHIVATDVSENSSNGSTVVVETNKLPKSAQPDTSLVQTSAVTVCPPSNESSVVDIAILENQLCGSKQDGSFSTSYDCLRWKGPQKLLELKVLRLLKFGNTGFEVICESVFFYQSRDIAELVKGSIESSREKHLNFTFIMCRNIIISYGEFLHATGFQPQQAAKILVEVELSKGFPSRIAANDENGFISMVDVDYAWLPSKCERCGQLGYKIKHCLESVTKSHIVATDVSENPSNCSTVVVETNKLLKSAQSALL